MTTINNFEDLNTWKKARKLCQVIGKLMKNEGFDKSSNKEFRQYFSLKALNRKLNHNSIE